MEMEIVELIYAEDFWGWELMMEWKLEWGALKADQSHSELKDLTFQSVIQFELIPLAISKQFVGPSLAERSIG